MSSQLPPKKVTKWTCDVCQVEAFDTFEEADLHERNCRGINHHQGPIQRHHQQDQRNPHQHHQMTIHSNAGYQSQQQQQQQQNFVNLSTSTTQEHTFPQHQNGTIDNNFLQQSYGVNLHQQHPPPFHHQQLPIASNDQLTNQSRQQQKLQGQSPQEQQTTKPTIYKTIWTCDVCKVAEFDSFEKAVKHEKNCKGLASLTEQVRPPPTIAPPPMMLSKNQQQQQQPVLFSQPPIINTNNNISNKISNTNHGHNNPIHGDNPHQQVAPKKCFVCDICRCKLFETYEEAVEHESKCMGELSAMEQQNITNSHGESEKKSSKIIVASQSKTSQPSSSASVSASSYSRLQQSPVATSVTTTRGDTCSISPNNTQPHPSSLSSPAAGNQVQLNTGGCQFLVPEVPVTLKNQLQSANINKEQQENKVLQPDCSTTSVSSSGPMTDKVMLVSNRAPSSTSAPPIIDLSHENVIGQTKKQHKSLLLNSTSKLSRTVTVTDKKRAKDPITYIPVYQNSDNDNSASSSSKQPTRKDVDSGTTNPITTSNTSTSAKNPVEGAVILSADANTNDRKGEAKQSISTHSGDLSPLLRSDGDSPDFYKISSFHAALMSSVDAFEEIAFKKDRNLANSQEEVLSFRCNHCKKKLKVPEPSSFWTVNVVADLLCSVIYDHLRTSCAKVPESTTQRLKANALYQESGKITFSEFIIKFCKENGIVDNKRKESNGHISTHIILLRPPLWGIDANSICRRREEVVTFNQRKHVFRVLPMNGIKEAEALEATLSPINSTTVKQIEFMILRPQKTSVHNVAIRCKHCGSSSYLKSLTNWFQVVYTMTYSHLIKSCQAIPPETREYLKTHQGNRKGANTGKTTGLKHYCDFLSRYYKFEEVNSSSLGPRVGIKETSTNAMDDCVNLTEKKRKLFQTGRDSVVSGPKGYQQQENKKSKRSSTTTTIPVSKRNFVSTPLVSTDGILIEGNDGCSTYLIPPTGVPLLSSLTARMAYELNVHNKLLIDHFELYEKEKQISHSASFCSLALRCQNCNSEPSKSYNKSLTSVTNFDKILGRCRNHLEVCKSTPEAIRKEVTRTKSTNSIGCITLKEYCAFLTEVYGLVNAKSHNSSDFVTWNKTCKYVLSDYSSVPGLLVKHKEQPIQEIQKISMTNKSSHVNRPRIILSDYHYFILGQIELVTVPKSINKTQTEVQVGVRCKHCGNTNVMKSIENFVCNRLHQFHSHLKCCTEVSKEFIEIMENLKSKDEYQRSSNDSSSTLEEAAMIVLEDIFQLENSESENQGVVLNTKNADAWEIIQKLGASQDNLNLKICGMSLLSIGKIFFPMLLKEVMIPFSESK